ncbi:hypothetical protein PHYSODRAFT_261463 [Phytophthora sojae]|uniref:Uncharacterized protein n=1 Tax=Phytophthora sojae (strain P6497) TaxID=1094619 RepID=G4ZDN0_PHYSP|nr:hypothetical protein PHYSODRAFT_261463 [Phytophthora sojae]EGZ18369.1 hypothetical protein PHYSODRAFT_261463 [Phytophthora sojae]|eukprot:XP_009527427.1 hypothetical protein PHYSODRAFT_261463 [Phytophthora sojae]
MGCRLVTPKDALAPSEQGKAEPTRLTERQSSCEDSEPEAEAVGAIATKHKPLHSRGDSGSELPGSSSSSLSVVPASITSQISDIVDLCEGMKEEDVQAKSEAVLERILRAQYRVDQLGDEAPHKTVELLSGAYTRFQAIVAEYAETHKAADATVDALEEVDSKLDVVNGQLDES